MEQNPSRQLHYSSSKPQEPDSGLGGAAEFNLKEWGIRARMISRDNTLSRRFSASNISRLREEEYTKSFRSNFTISSTASSPGYPLIRDEIDPSTYSFTTALKALQARTGCVWECLSPEGFALNSKWNEAEKYICNPLSGEFPKECLSAKTLSGRSLHDHFMTSRITMSAPLIYPSSHHHHQSTRHFQATPSLPLTVQGKKIGVVMTRDVGIQSTPAELSSASPSPTSTLSIAESIRFKRAGVETRESEKKVEDNGVAGGAGQGDKRGMGDEEEEGEGEQRKEEKQRRRRCKWRQSRTGCLWWMRKMKREEEVEENKPSSKNRSLFLCSH